MSVLSRQSFMFNKFSWHKRFENKGKCKVAKSKIWHNVFNLYYRLYHQICVRSFTVYEHLEIRNYNINTKSCGKRLNLTNVITKVLSAMAAVYGDLNNPFTHIDAFWRLCSRRLFENIVTKGEIAQNVQFLLLPQRFPLFVIGYPFNYGDFLFFDKIRSKLSAAELPYQGKG